MEDIAAGQSELGLELERRPCLEAGAALGSTIRQSSIGSASTESATAASRRPPLGFAPGPI